MGVGDTHCHDDIASARKLNEIPNADSAYAKITFAIELAILSLL